MPYNGGLIDGDINHDITYIYRTLRREAMMDRYMNGDHVKDRRPKKYELKRFTCKSCSYYDYSSRWCNKCSKRVKAKTHSCEYFEQ